MSKASRWISSVALLPWFLAACGQGGGGGSTNTLSTSQAPAPLGASVSFAYALSSDGTVSWYRDQNALWSPTGYQFLGTAASGLAWSPQGNALYVLEHSTGTILGFTPNPDGSLSSTGSTALAQPQAAIASPAGQTLYVAAASQIYVFPITANGALGAAGQTVATSATGQAFAFSLNGQILYVAAPGALQAYTVSSTGSLAVLGAPVSISANPVALSVDPQGRQLYLADRSAGTLSVVPLANGTPGGSPYQLSVPAVAGVEADPQGLYVYAAGSDGVHSYTVSAGHLTAAAGPVALTSGSAPAALTLNATGTELDVASAGVDTITRYALTQGVPTALPPTRTRNAPIALALSTKTVTETPTFVFASNELNDTLFGFTSIQGTLVPGNSLATGSVPQSLATDTRNQILYVADAGNGTVLGDLRSYHWNATGGLSAAANPALVGGNPVAVALDPSDRYLYAVDLAAGNLYTFTTSANGTLTVVTTTSAATGPQAVAVDPTGQFLYVAEKDSAAISVYQLDPATGVPHLLNTVPVATDPYALRFDVSGNYLYVTSLGALSNGTTASGGTLTAFQISPATGALTNIGTYPTGVTPKSLAVADNQLYVVDSGSDQLSQYGLNPLTGTAAPGATLPATAYPHALAIDNTQTLGVLSGNTDGLLEPYTISTQGTLTPGTSVSIGPGAYAVRMVDVAH